MERRRLDLLLVERGIASTRSKAQELIANGHILVDGVRARKAGESVLPTAKLEAEQAEHPYVSRGGVKLAAALRAFSLDIVGKVALDIGLSTGGFSDCLLRHGMAKVYGVDVGTAQLAESLRHEPRLHYWENTAVKDLRPEMLGEPVDLLVADLSFISLEKVIPLFRVFLRPTAHLVLLVKPQFELGPKALNGKGIVNSAELRQKAVSAVTACCENQGYAVLGAIPSPIAGGEGNLEYFLHAVLRSPSF